MRESHARTVAEPGGHLEFFQASSTKGAGQKPEINCLNTVRAETITFLRRFSMDLFETLISRGHSCLLVPISRSLCSLGIAILRY